MQPVEEHGDPEQGRHVQSAADDVQRRPLALGDQIERELIHRRVDT